MSIPFSDLRVHLHQFAQIPVGPQGNSENVPRINMVRELPDKSGRLAVIDLNGYLYLLDEAGQHNLYLNFRNHFPKFIDSPGKGTGAGAMAFHPEFAENGIFYTTHAEQNKAATADFRPIDDSRITLQWVLTRWVATDPAAATFAGTKEEMVRMEFTTQIHGTQDITFNPYAEKGSPDYGMLYICQGEGGASEAGKYQNVANKASFMGAIWRIDPEGTNSRNGKYGIPADNPFVEEAGSVKELWAYGFRNPHRLAFEQRGEKVLLFVGDIGQHAIEEVNLIEKGGNYGWDKREGTFEYRRTDRKVYALPATDPETYYYPVAQYDHDEGAAVSLGFAWKAAHSPAFMGQFFLGDILHGHIFHAPLASLEQGSQQPLKKARIVTPDGTTTTFREWITANRVDLRFARKSSGEIMLFTKTDGRIYNITDGSTLSSNRETYETAFWFAPNPASDRLTIYSKGQGQILVLDLSGKQLVKETVLRKEQAIDISQLARGAYILVLEGAGQTQHHLFLKQ
ncbi:PQQ-dependent sugar dehydrogenase [Pontibacter beigongshangensis]|uniref:PQQ-dependent sugar dehydrogenase n=1 Tax=Pontibacter beigongshangensis TaxID=2574733 RepID=UPI00164EDA66|nr:PQQ-dependent sugar dehydrogenase [Pontibacter beigongshangensis]